MWNLISVHLETMLCWCNIGARFAPNVPYAQKLFWTHPTILLGHKAEVEACLSPFRDSAKLDARYVRGLCQTYHSLKNHIGRT
jgi:hypothetical protein